MTIVTYVAEVTLCHYALMYEPEELAQRFNELVKQKRTDMGLSHEELAVRAGLNRSTISLYEAGKRVPSLSSAARIAQALEIQFSDMIREAENEK